MHLSEKSTTYKSSSFTHQDSNNSTKPNLKMQSEVEPRKAGI